MSNTIIRDFLLESEVPEIRTFNETNNTLISFIELITQGAFSIWESVEHGRSMRLCLLRRG